MSDIWGPVIGCLGFTTLLILPVVLNKIIKFKLEIAKINAETTIRTEEIRSRNQYEFEKYLKQEENSPKSEEEFENSNKSRVRI